MSSAAHTRTCHALHAPVETSLKFSDTDSVHLINAILAGLSVDEAQRTPELQKYTRQEISSAYTKYIHDPPKAVSLEESDSMRPFSVEEDFHILGFKRLLETGVKELNIVREFVGKIPINRTAKEIYQRMRELSQASEDEIDHIVDEYAKQLIEQEDGIDPTIVVDDAELDRLEKHFDIIVCGRFERESIAMFAGSNAVYYMCFRTVTIGTGQNCMVNLDNFEPDLTKDSMTGFDAVVTFESNGDFYIQNKGRREFRVNGSLIEPQRYTRLENRAILDFRDIIFVFIINEKKVSDIISTVDAKLAQLFE